MSTCRSSQPMNASVAEKTINCQKKPGSLAETNLSPALTGGGSMRARRML